MLLNLLSRSAPVPAPSPAAACSAALRAELPPLRAEPLAEGYDADCEIGENGDNGARN